MRILHVTPYYAPAWAYGGVVRAVTGLAAAQAALGHEVTILTTDALTATQRAPALRETLDGVRIIRCRNLIPALRSANLSSPIGMRRVLAQLQPEVIHCHELRTVENLIVAAGGRAPLVVSPHGTLTHNTGRARFKSGWDRLFGRALANRFTGVIALTEQEATEARTWWEKMGSARVAVAVIPNGVDISPHPPAPSPQTERGRSQKQLPFVMPHGKVPGSQSEINVLFLGRLHERKGLQFLIPAFAGAGVPGARLIIAGPDEGMLARARQMAVGCGVAEKVTFTGLLSGAEREAALAAAQVFVLPAVGEGLSMAALEAMAAGLPVILTPGCNLPEVEPRGAGLVVAREVEPLAAAISELLTDSARRARMGAAGRAWMQESFAWPAIASQVVAFYGTLSSNPTPASPAKQV